MKQVFENMDNDGSSTPDAVEAPGKTSSVSTPATQPPAVEDENEAYCSYMAREVVRGALTPGPSTAIPPECRATMKAALVLKAQRDKDGQPPFAMGAVETDREIARLLAPPSANVAQSGNAPTPPTVNSSVPRVPESTPPSDSVPPAPPTTPGVTTPSTAQPTPPAVAAPRKSEPAPTAPTVTPPRTPQPTPTPPTVAGPTTPAPTPPTVATPATQQPTVKPR